MSTNSLFHNIVHNTSVHIEQVTSSVELITPETARQMLLTQRQNRRINEARITEYAARMKRGEWIPAQTISFDWDGCLIDGQHRLKAVIRANMPIEFCVLRGLDPKAQLVMDIGQNRSVAQIATLGGVNTPNITLKLAIVRSMFLGQLLKHKTKASEKNAKQLVTFGGTNRAISPQLIISLYEAHREAVDFSAKTFGAKYLSISAFRAAVARAYYHENHQRLAQFLEVVDTGFTQTSCDDAAVALRGFLVQPSVRSSGNTNVRLSVYAKTQAALVNFLEYKNIRTVRDLSTEQYPVPDFD